MTGRELPPTSPFAGDDGSADPAVAAALADLGAGGTVAGVVAALAGTRVLVPVLAELDSAGTVEVGGHAHTVEKEASAGIVALRAPDGRTALPVFSSVATMTAWRADARPVPTEVARAALSAVQEGWELLVLDPGGPVTALLPRPAVWALAQQQPWRPAVTGTGAGAAVDPEVAAAVRGAVLAAVGPSSGGEPGPGPRGRWFRRAAPAGHPGVPVRDVAALPGGRAEVAVELTLVPGLDRVAVDAVVRRVGEALGADETVTQRVDSVEVRLR
ncbi:SseB family protein [Cellulomonas sp. P4]|uniref:SseB family protein n=1 Tax=Cellulomonas sp. P4 TaxID=3142533 RepID=UPI0031B9EBE2